MSDDPIPDNLQFYIDTWKKLLPDYQIILWDKKRFDINSVPWVKEAYEAKKYAFAADYIRCYALFNYGGIYLDSDVEVLKPFDSLLCYPYLIGKENEGIWEAATMGAEKGMQLFGLMLEYYKERHFKKEDKSLDMKPLPHIIRDVALSKYETIEIEDINDFEVNSEKLQILPVDYFSPKKRSTGKINTSPNTYSIHHFRGSWVSPYRKLMIKLSRKLPRLMTTLASMKKKIIKRFNVL